MPIFCAPGGQFADTEHYTCGIRGCGGGVVKIFLYSGDKRHRLVRSIKLISSYCICFSIFFSFRVKALIPKQCEWSYTTNILLCKGICSKDVANYFLLTRTSFNKPKNILRWTKLKSLLFGLTQIQTKSPIYPTRKYSTALFLFCFALEETLIFKR